MLQALQALHTFQSMSGVVAKIAPSLLAATRSDLPRMRETFCRHCYVAYLPCNKDLRFHKKQLCFARDTMASATSSAFLFFFFPSFFCVLKKD